MFAKAQNRLNPTLFSLKILFAFFASSFSGALAESAYIEIQSAKLRSEPKAWSAPILDLKYGEEVEIIEKTSSWLKVKTKSNSEGFLHVTATTSRPVILKSTATTSARLDSFEAVLAGKGFSSATELNYAKSHEKLDFTLVDMMENRSRAVEPEVLAFMKEGKLNIKAEG